MHVPLSTKQHLVVSEYKNENFRGLQQEMFFENSSISWKRLMNTSGHIERAVHRQSEGSTPRDICLLKFHSSLASFWTAWPWLVQGVAKWETEILILFICPGFSFFLQRVASFALPAGGASPLAAPPRREGSRRGNTRYRGSQLRVSSNGQGDRIKKYGIMQNAFEQLCNRNYSASWTNYSTTVRNCMHMYNSCMWLHNFQTAVA